jgi:hypothetical protein
MLEASIGAVDVGIAVVGIGAVDLAIDARATSHVILRPAAASGQR